MGNVMHLIELFILKNLYVATNFIKLERQRGHHKNEWTEFLGTNDCNTAKECVRWPDDYRVRKFNSIM